jgi:thymidylate kinase
MLHNIGLEGGVGSGKTTVSKLLKHSGFFHSQDYMRFLSPLMHGEISNWSPEFRFQFFESVEKVRQPPNECNVVQDRTFLSIFAHDFALKQLGIAVNLDPYKKRLETTLVLPSTIVFLDVSAQERAKRLKKRNRSGSDYIYSELFSDAVKQYFIEFGELFGVKFINTELAGPEEVASKVQAYDYIAQRAVSFADAVSSVL